MSQHIAPQVEQASLEKVERAMQKLVHAELSERGARMALEQLSSGGKRLRARIALLASEALGAPARPAIEWAAAVEILHNATLIHDDVQDGDRLRRGRPTLWARHGSPQAINAGDAMLMLPYLALRGLPLADRGALSTLLAEYSIETVRGQIDEIDLLPHEKLDWASYVHAVAGKTGALFALPVVGAAVLAGRSEAEARAMGAPFGRLGVAFQILDDVLDLYGEKGREATGNDLREGKVSALVVAHLALRPHDRGWLLELLRAPREATPEAGVAHATQSFRASGALDMALDLADNLKAEAESAPALVGHPLLAAVARDLVEACSPASILSLRGVA